MVFEKSLTSMVKGIRAHRGKESDYINVCVQEIQKEIISKNMSTKSMAILKLTYLNMLGYDMSWATFAVVEVMSTSRFAIKRPGYLASAISFTDTTDVGLLTINLFKKDFGSKSQYESGMAISTLSSIVTPEISRDIVTDLLSLLSSSRAYLRKKTVLCLYRIFLKDPPALRTCYPKLKDRLGDEDQGVLTATVNTFLELARKNARNYLSLVPQLYHILVNTTNNWLSIKLLKVFQLLCPLEPRLQSKMVEPLTNILNTTKAQSVEFEAIRTVIRTQPGDSALAGLCVEKLQAFLNSSDRNLRYLALELFKEMLEFPEFKEKLQLPDLHEKVLQGIEESDITARRVALTLLDRIVSPSNFQDAVQKLMEFSRKAMPNDEFLCTILRMGARDRYALVEDFAWYLLILAEIGRNMDSAHAATVAQQFVDVCVRVPQVRPYAVTLCLGLLERSPSSSPARAAAGSDASAPERREASMDVSTPMIGACAWIIGEYHADIEKPAEAAFLSGAECLLASKPLQALEPAIQSQCIWAAAKLYLSAPLHAPEAVSQLHELLNSSLPTFVRSTHVDVAERAALALHIATFYKADAQQVAAGAALFEEPLLPVHQEAQAALQVPQGLDLEQEFFPQEPEQAAFMPVGSNSQDPYALAATYKDDLGFLVSSEARQAGATPASSSSGQTSSMFYLQSKDRAPQASQEAGATPTPAAPEDPLVAMRQKLEAARGAGGLKYQVMREDIGGVPGGTAGAVGSSAGGQAPSASSSATSTLPTFPEKELTELQGRLWSVCFRGEHVAVYACVRSPNVRKQLLRIDLRCERLGAPESPWSVSDVSLRFPDGVTAQEADASSGLLSLAPGELQQRSAKVKATIGTAPFLSPGAFDMQCELQYTLNQTAGETPATSSRESTKFGLRMPATTFLVPRVMTEDDIAEYIAQNSTALLSHQTAQALSFAVTGNSTDLLSVVGRCAGLCHFHGILNASSDQSKGQKFLLVAGPASSASTSALEGQLPLPANANIVCLCAGLERDSSIELRVTVKVCRKDIADDVCSQIATTFRELVEGRLRAE